MVFRVDLGRTRLCRGRLSTERKERKASTKYNLKDVIRKSLYARRQRPSVGRQNEITRPSTRGPWDTRHKGSFAEDTAQQSWLKGSKPLIVSRLTSIKRYLMNKTFASSRDQPQSFALNRNVKGKIPPVESLFIFRENCEIPFRFRIISYIHIYIYRIYISLVIA